MHCSLKSWDNCTYNCKGLQTLSSHAGDVAHPVQLYNCEMYVLLHATVIDFIGF
jgi:hypothetical protein